MFCYRRTKIYTFGAWNKEDVGSAPPWHPQSLSDSRCLCQWALQGAIVANDKYICKILDPTLHNCLIPLTGSAVSSFSTDGLASGCTGHFKCLLLIAQRSARTAQPVSTPSSCVFIRFSAIPTCLTGLVAKWVTLGMFPILCCYQWLGGLKFYITVCQWWQKFSQRSKKMKCWHFVPKSLMW